MIPIDDIYTFSKKVCLEAGNALNKNFGQLKTINDKFGHAAGDRVLRDFAGLLENCCRKADLYARLSGDEFVILFTDLNTSACDTIMQRLLLSFSDLPNSFNNQIELSFSYGIADFSDQQPCSLTKLLSVADSRMYAEKAQKKAR